MNIFSRYMLGDIELQNRIVMAPMTRCRSVADDVPGPLMPGYYAQRASAGLIIAEGAQVSPLGKGYSRTPGIYSPAQVEGWRKVTEAIHLSGGKIFLQLWHVGRVSHPDILDGQQPVAPSALPVEGTIHTPVGKKNFVIPRALTYGEVLDIITQFHDAALNAKEAGFDGVEIHGANGYLLDEFLRDGSNSRTDEYGGSIANRCRLPLEVTEAVTEVFGNQRVGYRISPHNTNHSMSDSNPLKTFSYLTNALNRLNIGYLHIIEPVTDGRTPAVPVQQRIAAQLHTLFKGTFMLNGGRTKEIADQEIISGAADLISFGEAFIANPDLPFRFKNNLPLNTADPHTYYVGEEQGYTDYPFATGHPREKQAVTAQTL